MRCGGLSGGLKVWEALKSWITGSPCSGSQYRIQQERETHVRPQSLFRAHPMPSSAPDCPLWQESLFAVHWESFQSCSRPLWCAASLILLSSGGCRSRGKTFTSHLLMWFTMDVEESLESLSIRTSHPFFFSTGDIKLVAETFLNLFSCFWNVLCANPEVWLMPTC